MQNVLVFLGLAALFAGWNLPNHYPLWTTFHGEFAAALGVCLLFAATLCMPRSASSSLDSQKTRASRVVTMSLPSRAWLAAAFLPVVQHLVGLLPFRGDAVLGFLYAGGTALALYTGALWAAQVGRAAALRALFITILASALVAGGLAIAQWLRVPAASLWQMELIDSRPFANFGQPNLFALLMVMGIVAVTALLETGEIRQRWVHGMASAFLGWCVVISQSRACLLGLLLIAICWCLTRHRAPSKLRLVDVASGIALMALGHLSLGSIEDALYLASGPARGLADVGARQWIWLHFWTAIIHRPWGGYGFGQGVLALREVAEMVHPSRNVIYAHNMALDLMTWFGIPVGSGLAIALVAWMGQWLRHSSDAELDVHRHLVFALWLALATHAMLEFPHAHTFFLLPAALAAGMLDAPASPDLDKRAAPSTEASVWAAILAVLLMVLTHDYFGFEAEFRENRFDKANFSGRMERTPPAMPWLLDQLGALNESAHYDIRPGMSVDDLAALELLARRFHVVSIRLQYARALALNGRMPEAETELRAIRAVQEPSAYARIERQWSDWLAANHALTGTH